MENQLVDNVIDLAQKTGRYIRTEMQGVKKNEIEKKGLHNFVTEIDKKSEKDLVEVLQQLIPEAGFIAEEGTSTKKGETYNWIIDPLDGTTNFIHGVYPVSISIALQKNDKTIFGLVYEIGLDECFYATKNGAWLNGSSIKVSATPHVSDALIGTGFPYYDYKRIQPFLQTLDYFMRNSHGIRRPGSAATDLAYVACGRYDAFYEYSLSPWDVAAGAFIVQQAGGLVSDFSGEDNYIFGKEIIAANNYIFNEFLEIINKYMI